MSKRTPQQEAERRQRRREERYEKPWPLLVRYADRGLPMSALPQVATHIGRREDELEPWLTTLTDDCGFAEVEGGVLRLNREGRAHFVKTLPDLRKGGRLPTPPGGFGVPQAAMPALTEPGSANLVETIKAVVRAELLAADKQRLARSNPGQPPVSAFPHTPRKPVRKPPQTNPDPVSAAVDRRLWRLGCLATEVK